MAAIDVMQRAAFMAADPERHNVGIEPPYSVGSNDGLGHNAENVI